MNGINQLIPSLAIPATVAPEGNEAQFASMAALIVKQLLSSMPDGAAARLFGPQAVDMTILDFFDQHYLVEHEIRAETATFYRMKIRQYSEWLGHEAKLVDLNDDTVNRFLMHRLSIRSKETAKGEKATLASLWLDAARRGFINNAPLRLRKMKREERIIEGWNPQELSRLLAAAMAEVGRFRGKWLLRSAYWKAYILTAYETGLRCGDLLSLKSSDVTGPGSIVIVQRKTRKIIETGISEETWAAIAATDPQSRERIFGCFSRRYFFIMLRKIVKRAGLKGSGKFLRRTSGSMVESIAPGRGHEHLGHADRSTFERHYHVRGLTKKAPVLPPQIKVMQRPGVAAESLNEAERPSKYLGVVRCGDAFRAQISLPSGKGMTRKTKYLGRFKTEEEAARAHDQVAREFGRKLNFPDDAAVLPA